MDGAGTTGASPEFGGGFWERSKLTGDWGGVRSRLAQAGVTLDADVTQFYQGVTSGGRQRTFEYGGHGDYVLNVDAGKLGGLAGLFVTVRAEHRFGENINQETGTLLPAAVAANLPIQNSTQVYLTDVLVTQFLSDWFALFAGKMQTLDDDMNAFAHGRGKEQFLNMAFVNDPAQALTIPYSTLGAGFVLVKDKQPWLNVTVLNATDTTKTAGFNELFKHGVAVNPEMRLPTRFFDRPGHQLIGGTWNSKDFLALGQDPRVDLPSIPLEKRQSAWSIYWNFDQYISVDPRQPFRFSSCFLPTKSSTTFCP
ncbi:MAG: carbohydrate porin, partial [Nitrospiraceae bacterium]